MHGTTLIEKSPEQQCKKRPFEESIPKVNKRPRKSDIFSIQPPTPGPMERQSRPRSRPSLRKPFLPTIRSPSPHKSPSQRKSQNAEEVGQRPSVQARVLEFGFPTPPPSSEEVAVPVELLEPALANNTLKPPAKLKRQLSHEETIDLLTINRKSASDIPLASPDWVWWVVRQNDGMLVRKKLGHMAGRVYSPAALFVAAGWHDRGKRRVARVLSRMAYIFLDANRIPDLDLYLKGIIGTHRKSGTSQSVLVYDFTVLDLPKCLSVEQIPQPLRIL